MTDGVKTQAKTETTGAKDRLWELRLWSGMSFSGVVSLLARNRLAVSLPRVGMAVIMIFTGMFNSFLRFAQWVLLGRKIARAEICDDPVFVVGHWRSGTTLLHELMVLDDRFTYPDTYACFAPNHFLLTRRWLPQCLRMLLPSRRPMDNVRVGWRRPQEDEFALCSLGLPSLYLTWAFSNRPPQCLDSLEVQGLPPRQRNRWKRVFLWFLKCVTVQEPKPIVLKSPTHTCRVKTLLELFPNARFVHIVRNPYVVYPSMVNTLRRMYKYHGLQTPKYVGLEDFILGLFNRVYEDFERDRELIDPERFCEIRYEDLVADPIGQMRTVYEQLGLDRFDDVLPALQQHLCETADYKTNRYDLPAETRQQITQHWGEVIRRYGYEE